MKPETLGEATILLNNLDSKLDTHMVNSQKSYAEIMECIKELNKTCDLTLQQALKTNGRVNIIEPLALDYQETRARVRGATWVIALVGVTLVTIGGFALNSYLNYKTEQVIITVEKHLEDKYNIEYVKEDNKNNKKK